jgi:hypothetical protein
LTEIVQTFAQKIRGHWKSDRAWLTINRAWLTMSFDRNAIFLAKIGIMGKN